MKTVYNRTNFFKHTYCIFQEVANDGVPNDLKKPHYTSKSGSVYYYTNDGVYRKSNHWGRAANCRWKLIQLPDSIAGRTKIGFAKWTSFYRDNDVEKLYCIVVDNNEVYYKHKEELKDSSRIFRTAPETTSVIRKIKALLKRSAFYEDSGIDEQIHNLIFNENT